MRFAISIPQHVGAEGFDAASFRHYVARAEELGFESGWTQEQVLGPGHTLSPIEAMLEPEAEYQPGLRHAEPLPG